MSTLKMYIIIISILSVPAQSMLYKRIHLPLKNSDTITYEERLNVESKFECAGLCALETPKCKGYFYDSISRKCKKIDLDNASEQDVNFERPITGYLDYGMPFGIKRSTLTSKYKPLGNFRKKLAQY